MSVFSPPLYKSDVFNSSLYDVDESTTLTIYDGDRRYLKLTGGIVSGITTFSSNMTLNASLTFSGTVSGPIVNSNTYLLSGSSMLASALTGITAGTATASKALVLDASSNITGIVTLGLSSTSGGDMLTLTTTSTAARNTIKFITDTQNWEIGSRGSTASNANNFYIYNSSYKLLMNPTGDTSILSSSDSTSATTGCLMLTGGLGVVKNIYTTGTLTLNRNGSNLSIINGANSGLIEVSAGGSGSLRVVNGTCLNISSGGLTVASSSTALARYNLDMQASVADIKLCLYQNGSNGTYGFGASGSALNVITGGSSIKFYKTATGGSLGTNTATIDTDGNFDAINNIFGGTGIGCRSGFSSSSRTGLMGIYHFANSVYGELFTYNYSTATFRDLLIGDTLLVQGGVKNVGIGIANPSSDIIAYPFVVNKTINSSISGAYGYLATSGAGTGTGTGSVPVSIYTSGRIFCTEYDAYSDARKKKNIEQIDALKADEFIDKVTPVEYEWKNPNEAGRRTGYIAQQLLSTGLFEDLVTYHVDSTMQKDDSGSPEGYSLTIQYNNVIAILHQALKNQREIIRLASEEAVRAATQARENQKKINELELKINELIYS